MKYFALAVASLIVAAPVVAQKTPVPDLLKRALASPASKQLFAYDFETISDNISNDETTHTVVRGHIDTSRKKGDRVTITAVEDNSKKPRDARKVDEQMEKSADGDIYCDSVSREDVTNVVDKGAAPGGGRQFTFTPRSEKEAEGEMKEIMKKMSADVVVDEATGQMRSFSGTLTRKHSIMFIAEVKSATFSSTCAPLPNGRAYSARTDIKANISAFGNNFSTTTVQTVSNVVPVG